MKSAKYILIALLLVLTSCKVRHTDTKDGFKEDEQVLRIACAEELTSYDPRKVRGLVPVTVLHMLYEGLMRLDNHGRPTNALAEAVHLSQDAKTYTFKLRKAKWSNGDPVTAFDFAETWKSILDPNFPAPNAYQFYLIKNAKEAKEGSANPEEIGIKATDPSTLVVELTNPAPYFLDLVCTHFFYAVHPKSSFDQIICNGPFTVKKWKQNNEILFEKNKDYWDREDVHLDGIALYILDDQTALRMFERGELDWAGSPMGTLPQDALPTLKHAHQLRVSPAAGTHWFRFNTGIPPFNNLSMRKAFTYSLNRKDIIEYITQGFQRPAEAIVPPNFGLSKNSYFADHAVPSAWYAFQEALEEMKIAKDELPEIVLSYAVSDRNNKIAQAVQQEWKKALGITVRLEGIESKIFFERLNQKKFQMAIGSWYADFRDPINFLEVFKSKNNTTNNTHWENERFTKLLNKSDKEADSEKRLSLLSKAQGILMQELPVAPLFFGSFNYVKKEELLGVYFCDLGYLDFKYAFFSR